MCIHQFIAHIYQIFMQCHYFIRMRSVCMTSFLFACKMAAVLEKLPVNAVFHVGVVLPLGTIFLCYTVATSLDHVPVWLPMISDCAVLPPEKYPFRWGIVLSAAIFAGQSVLLYGADRPYSRSKVALFLGLLTSFCLSVVGVVNEAEDNTIHSSKNSISEKFLSILGLIFVMCGLLFHAKFNHLLLSAAAAVIFFFGYLVYMVVLTWLLPQYKKQDRPSNLAYLFRQLCVVLAVIDLAFFAYMSSNWEKYGVYLAVCEW